MGDSGAAPGRRYRVEEIVVGVRPKHFELGSVGVEMEVDVVEELGADAYLYGRITGADTVISKPVIARTDRRAPPGKAAGCTCNRSLGTCIFSVPTDIESGETGGVPHR